MEDWISDTADSWGYLGVAFLMLLENIFPPIPSEVVMPAAGAAARSQNLSLIGIIVAGTSRAVLGAIPWYAVACWVGTSRFQDWMERHGHWFGTDAAEIERLDDWFDRYGYWAVLIGRLVPGGRTLISIPAGFSEMPLGSFLVATGIGTAIWTTLLAELGYWLEGKAESIAQVLKAVGLGVVVVMLVLYAVKVIRHSKTLSNSPSSTEDVQSTN